MIRKYPPMWLMCLIVGGLVAGCCTKKKLQERTEAVPVAQPAEPAIAGFGAALPEEPKGPSSVSFMPVLFDTDSSVLTPQAQKELDEKVTFLKNAQALKVAVSGHCDERGPAEYNLRLGHRRAYAVATYINQKLANKDVLYGVYSSGEDEPKCTESTPACWAKNRRAEITAVIP